jgi:hypothetical protein
MCHSGVLNLHAGGLGEVQQSQVKLWSAFGFERPRLALIRAEGRSVLVRHRLNLHLHVPDARAHALEFRLPRRRQVDHREFVVEILESLDVGGRLPFV